MSTNHNLFEEKGEPKRNRAVALLLSMHPSDLPLEVKPTRTQNSALGLYIELESWGDYCCSELLRDTASRIEDQLMTTANHYDLEQVNGLA